MKTAVLFVIIYAGLLNSAAAQFIFTPKKPVTSRNEIIDQYEGSQLKDSIPPKKPVTSRNEIIDQYEGSQLKDSIPFSYIRIIDSRYDTTDIGLYVDGYLVLKDSSQPLALQHTLDKYYHNLYTPGKDTLVIQLEKLFITDRLVDDTAFIVTCGAIICRQFTGNNNSYVYRGNFDTLINEKYSYHIYSTHKNGKHHNLEFWDYYLLRLCEAMIKNASQFNNTIDSGQQHFTVEDIKKEGLQKRQKPILVADSLNPGFYNNFSEFENNKPGFTYDSADALHKLLDLMHYRVSKKVSNEEPDTSYWGFCDGKNLYVRNAYSFFRLERKDAAFYIAPTLDAERRDVKTAGWDVLIGLVGLSAGIATKSGLDLSGFDAIPEPPVPCIILKINKANIWGVHIDWDTGTISY
jgi:hypothetical protein